MMALLLEPLQFTFMSHALLISLVVSIPCALLSVFLVLKGWALMGDAMSHAVLPGAALGFMWFGSNTEAEITHSIGYVHIYAFIGISVMSFMTAKLGAKVAHKLSPAMLKRCFACLLATVGSYFIYQGLSTFF